MPSETEKAYVAGFVDGEGCISINVNKKVGEPDSFYVHFNISNTNKSVLEYIQSLFGGVLRDCSNHLYGNRQHCYQVYWYSKSVKPVLKDLLPYLVVKRRVALLAIEFLVVLENQAQEGRELTKEKQETREEYFSEIRDLNRRGA